MWKTSIKNIDGLARRRAEQKKAHPTPAKFIPFKRAEAPAIKTGTGTTYGGQGQRMEVDLTKARTEGRCFKCGEKGHMSRFCPNKKIQVRVMFEGMSKEEKREIYDVLIAEKRSEDF